MKNIKFYLNFLLIVLSGSILCSCASYVDENTELEQAGYTVPTAAHEQPTGENADLEAAVMTQRNDFNDIDYTSRLPQHINTHGKKVILVDPNTHAWGAYDKDGNLVRAGLAACGADWCKDTGKPCRTSVGTYRIQSLHGAECVSSKYPKPTGGGPMPYAMFFHGSMALHGSPEMMDDNISHGCIRIPVNDAEWIRYNFAQVGTTIIVRPYQ